MNDDDEGDLVCMTYSNKDGIAYPNELEVPLQDVVKYLKRKRDDPEVPF